MVVCVWGALGLACVQHATCRTARSFLYKRFPPIFSLTPPPPARPPTATVDMQVLGTILVSLLCFAALYKSFLAQYASAYDNHIKMLNPFSADM